MVSDTMLSNENIKYGNLEQVYIILTETCNLSCSFCIRKIDSDNYIALDDVKLIFNKLAKHQDLFQLILSGGELTLHPNAFEIILLAKKQFRYVSIVTNGTNVHFFKKAWHILKDVHIQISIDGEENIHDKLRGLNSFKKAFETISLLVSTDIDITVASTVNKDNIKSFFGLYKIINRVGVKNWKLSPEILTNSTIDRQDKILEASEWNKFVFQIQKCSSNWNGKLYIKTLFHFVGKEIPWDLVENDFIRNVGCQPGIKKIYIYSDLSIVGCPCLKNFPLGDIKNSDLSDIIKEAIELNNFFAEKEDSICVECEYLLICKGGCPGASYQRYGMINKSDPRCPLVSSFSQNI